MVAHDHDGNPFVLLGKRRFYPFAGFWTVPGGELEEDRDKRVSHRLTQERTYRETSEAGALREFSEEVKLWTGAPSLPLPAALGEGFIFQTPVSAFTTFFLTVANPELKLPSVGRDVEFSKLKWFRIVGLPILSHPGIHEAISFWRKKTTG